MRPTATWDDIKEVCDAGVAYKTASVCIPPDFVASAHEAYPDLNICTVIGFPLGYETIEVKVAETKQALAEGASEIDMVINLGDVKQGDFEAVTVKWRALKEACGDKILKVIIETCYLTDSEKVALCKCITNGGADYIKTSTGFGSGGASLGRHSFIQRAYRSQCKIKAAGGIRSISDMKAYIAEGCSQYRRQCSSRTTKDHLDEEV